MYNTKEHLKRWHDMVYKYQEIETIHTLLYLGDDRFLANNKHNVSIDDIIEYCRNYNHFSNELKTFIRKRKICCIMKKDETELINTLIWEVLPPSEVWMKIGGTQYKIVTGL